MSNPSFGQALQAPKLDTLVPDIFRFTVNYGQPLEVMIAAGRYDWVNSDIRAERFPIDEGSGIVEFEGRYFHFTRNIFSEDVVKVIEVVDTNNPWSPAKSEHALSFGATYPGEQRTYPIVGLGSVAEVRGGRRVLCLCGGDSSRSLSLAWWGDGWHTVCRFLAVRKVSAS